MAEDFSNEGLYRLLKDMKDEHGHVLEDIRDETRKTNGRVSKLEERTEGQGRELGRLNSAVFPRPTGSSSPATLPVVTPEGESLSIRISPKMWALIAAVVSGLSIFGPIVADWVKHLMGQR